MLLHPLLCIIFLGMLIETRNVSSFGLVDYYDSCEFETVDESTFQSRYDQSKFCDTVRGLFCVPGLGKCGCVVPHTIYRAGKCRAKIGNTCLAAGNVRLDCVEHARCTDNNPSKTFNCQCIKGYLPNAMTTACFPVEYNYNDRRKARDRDRDGFSYWNGATTQSSQIARILFLTTTTFILCNNFVHYLTNLIVQV